MVHGFLAVAIVTTPAVTSLHLKARVKCMPIRGRKGETAEVAVGQTVSAWCSGLILSDPPGWGADAVIVEAAGR